MKDFISEEVEEVEEEESDGGGEGSDQEEKKRKKHRSDDEDDDQLDEEDFDLIDDNLGIKINRKVGHLPPRSECLIGPILDDRLKEILLKP